MRPGLERDRAGCGLDALFARRVLRAQINVTTIIEPYGVAARVEIMRSAALIGERCPRARIVIRFDPELDRHCAAKVDRCAVRYADRFSPGEVERRADLPRYAERAGDSRPVHRRQRRGRIDLFRYLERIVLGYCGVVVGGIDDHGVGARIGQDLSLDSRETAVAGQDSTKRIEYLPLQIAIAVGQCIEIDIVASGGVEFVDVDRERCHIGVGRNDVAVVERGRGGKIENAEAERSRHITVGSYLDRVVPGRNRDFVIVELIHRDCTSLDAIGPDQGPCEVAILRGRD